MKINKQAKIQPNDIFSESGICSPYFRCFLQCMSPRVMKSKAYASSSFKYWNISRDVGVTVQSTIALSSHKNGIYLYTLKATLLKSSAFDVNSILC